MLDDDDDDTILALQKNLGSQFSPTLTLDLPFSLYTRTSYFTYPASTAGMSYASANVHSGGSSVPHVDASFTTDPDKARKERAKDRVHYAEDRAKAWYQKVSDRIWMAGVAVSLSPYTRGYMYTDAQCDT